jgi:hypothetical protein
MRQLNKLCVLGLVLIARTAITQAALVIKVDEPKFTGSKAIIKLELKNTFTQKIESARAVIFLLGDQGKVVGQEARWIIGGTKDKPALIPEGTAPYYFVVSTDKPFTKTKLIVTRIIGR